ncbi:hypothetical protein [Devosia elaeis]|uniref:Uncharacterized protein n=1 Tax=Devosia elaeis TaxID=1770058 RepID=A0A178HYK9_9HYPH|nr:hypothetical protein [Devosia elaeis]OAM77757.1 hypothetical protein A3840_08405 [Devosia elaeis]
MTIHCPPRTHAERIDFIDLETKLYDAQRALRIADHFSCEDDGRELTAYAVQQAVAEVKAAIAAFRGEPAA